MSGFGPMLRLWRERRRLSQLELSTVAAVSQRHLSHLETGKSRPSREMVLHLAEVLDVPLRERNVLLGAAGLAAAYSHRPLDDPSLSQVREALDLMMDHHRPYPAVVVDRHWNLIRSNLPAQRLTSVLVDADSPALGDPPNLIRLLSHPDGLRKWIVNWDQLGPALAARLRREVEASPRDGGPAQLLDDLLGAVEGQVAVDPLNAPDMVVPVHYRRDDLELRMFSTLATIGSPLDVTVSELSIELFFPADEESARVLRRLDGS